MEATANDGPHEQDHRDIQRALTPSRRRWLIWAHLRRFHGVAETNPLTDPESCHDRRHFNLLPSVRLARAQRQSDALLRAVVALSEVDAEAGLAVATATIVKLIDLHPEQPLEQRLREVKP